MKIYSRAKVSIARCGGNRWGRAERSCSTLRDRRNGRRSWFEVPCKPLRRNIATNSGASQPISRALSVHSSLQMRASDANDTVLSYYQQMKRGDYEQHGMT